jgi:hypothetical protein
MAPEERFGRLERVPGQELFELQMIYLSRRDVGRELELESRFNSSNSRLAVRKFPITLHRIFGVSILFCFRILTFDLAKVG